MKVLWRLQEVAAEPRWCEDRLRQSRAHAQLHMQMYSQGGTSMLLKTASAPSACKWAKLIAASSIHDRPMIEILTSTSGPVMPAGKEAPSREGAPAPLSMTSHLVIMVGDLQLHEWHFTES